jgi:hypothetical protein
MNNPPGNWSSLMAFGKDTLELQETASADISRCRGYRKLIPRPGRADRSCQAAHWNTPAAADQARGAGGNRSEGEPRCLTGS